MPLQGSIRPFTSLFKLFLLGLAVLLPTAVYSQSTFGEIRGTIRDTGGLAVPQATVTLHDVDEGTSRQATTDDSGEYLFENLKPGNYTLTASKVGFTASHEVALELTARQSARADVTLSVGEVTQNVQVEAATPQINTENATIGDTRDTSQLVEMPLNSRAQTTSPLSALTLSPGVVTDSQGNIAVGGATFAQTGYSVDGISTANIAANGSLQNAYPSSEGLGELTVTSFNNSAEFAQVADVTFTTKSGTDQLHGSAFGYFQNDALDAKILNFAEKAPKQFETFGASLGGPITIPHVYNGKDKTFFFVDYEGNQRTISTPEQYLVPTVAERQGNLQGLLANGGTFVTPTGPNAGMDTNTLYNPNGGTFMNDTIPTGMLNQVAQNLLNAYYPLPNVNLNVPGASYNYEILQPTPGNTNGWDVRVDHNITSSQQIYARYSWKDYYNEVANPLLPNDQDSEQDRSFIVSYNYVIKPTLINEFRFGFTNSYTQQKFPILGANADDSLGLTGISFANHPTTGAFPTFNFNDGSGFTPIGHDKDGPGESKTLQFTDNLSKNIGKHTIRIGIDTRRVFYETVVRWGQSDDFGAFTFNQGVFTGSAFGDFLLGAPNTSFIVQSSPNTNESAWHWGTYAQDTWQATSRLTVNFGLRWEVNPKMSEQGGDIANFIPTANGEVVVPNNLAATVASSPLLQANYNAFLVSFNACSLPTRDFALPCSNVVTASQAGLPSSLSYTYWHDFDPRVSVAFRPFTDNRTVVRAGFGIFTNEMLGPFAYDNIGIPLGAPYTYSNNNGGSPLFQFPETSPTNQPLTYGGTGFYDGESAHFRDPQTMQWNATVEREFGSDTAVRVSYVGMYSYRLNETEDYNAIPASTTPYNPSPFVDPRAPYQNWIEIYYSANGGTANYNALVVDVTHKASHGVHFQGSYTLAKDLSDAQGDAPEGFVAENLLFTPVANQFDIPYDRGNVAGMPRQRFLLTLSYELPYGPGKFLHSENKFLNGAFGGWNLNTVTTVQTGQWLTPTMSPNLDASNTGVVERGGITLRPSVSGNPNVPTDGSLWNSNVYSVPANGTFGNAPVGSLLGPRMFNINAGLSKVFAVRERYRLRFEATFTNVLNHVNFAPPASDWSDPATFGVLESALPQGQGGNRTGQLALRLDF